MKSLKHRIFRIIQPSAGHDFASALFDWFIIVLIIVNVLLVVLDTFSFISAGIRSAMYVVEVFSVAVFTLEYLLRVWTADLLRPDIKPWKARIKYVLSFMAIIDLLAILPFYLPFVFPVDLRVLRMVRLLRLFRLFKVNRYTNALSSLGKVLKKKAAQLVSSMVVVLILMTMAAVLMYNIEYEAQPDVFQNAFSGFWWAIATLTTVGYGDIYPITALGKVLSALIALLGIGLVAIPTGIISAGFMENIEEPEKIVSESLDDFTGKFLSLDPSQQGKVIGYIDGLLENSKG